jgi:pimeloyl-ACP methyl ester carboxylesterase
VQQPKTQYARNGDVNIAYQVVGEGPIDLAIVPGFISHVDLWWTIPETTAFIRRLASFCRLILFDKRGTGLSDPVAGLSSLEDRMEDLHAVLDAAGSGRAALLGVSEGGPMSVLFAATYPERVAALALYGTFPTGNPERVPPELVEPTERKLAELTAIIDQHWGVVCPQSRGQPDDASSVGAVRARGRESGHGLGATALVSRNRCHRRAADLAGSDSGPPPHG